MNPKTGAQKEESGKKSLKIETHINTNFTYGLNHIDESNINCSDTDIK